MIAPAAAEFIGTFALILLGAGSACANAISGGALGVTGIALAHGLTIMVMAYSLGHVSGGHFNPAVTVPMLITKRIEPGKAVLYIAAQLAGAAAAGLLLGKLHPELVGEAPFLGACDLFNTSFAGGVAIEAVLTFFLVTVIWGLAVDPRSPKPAVGLAIGLTITACILMGGPSTGASLNPARAFGPALAANHWANHLVYWIGPILGGSAAGLLYENVFLKK
jgi:MIP family channel proteins